MAESVQHQGVAGQGDAPGLKQAIHEEGLEPVGTVAHEGVAPHTDPQALGLDATAWVSLAMAFFIAILLWKKVPALITRGLDNKIAAIRAQLDEAAKLRAEAEALKAEYEAKLAAITRDAETMRAHAQEEAKQVVSDAEANAATLIARRQKMAEDKIAAAERTAIADIRAKAVQAATSAAATLIAQGHDAQADKSMVDSAIKALGPVV